MFLECYRLRDRLELLHAHLVAAWFGCKTPLSLIIAQGFAALAVVNTSYLTGSRSFFGRRVRAC